MDKRPGTIGSMFDRIAPTYDRLNAVLSMGIDRLWRKRTIRALNLRPGHRVLDIASGTGDLAAEALKHCPCTVLGVDLSPEMLGVARQKLAPYIAQGRYDTLTGDALNLPLPDGEFDAAMVAFGVRNMESVEKFLDEMHRVLKPRGRLAVLEFSLPRIPLVRQGYLLYFTRVLPWIGEKVSGDREAYAYLRDSVMGFKEPREMTHLMAQRGFGVEQVRCLTLGIAHLYVLEKR